MPPFLVEGFQTLSMLALKVSAAAAPGAGAAPVPPVVGVEPPPLQAARPRARTVPAAAVASVDFLLITSAPLLGGELGGQGGQRLRGSSASRRPSPKRLKASTVMKIATPGTIVKCGIV